MTNSIVVEARLMKCGKRRDAKGDWQDATFQMHPDDDSYGLFRMPLGTRVALVVTQLVDDGPETSADEQTADEPTPQTPERLKGGPTGWSETKRKMVMRAALICKEEDFQRHIAHGWSVMWNHQNRLQDTPEERAAYFVRTSCSVGSRRDLEPGESSGEQFRQLVTRYEASQEGRTDPDLMQQAATGPR